MIFSRAKMGMKPRLSSFRVGMIWDCSLMRIIGLRMDRAVRTSTILSPPWRIPARTLPRVLHVDNHCGKDGFLKRIRSWVNINLSFSCLIRSCWWQELSCRQNPDSCFSDGTLSSPDSSKLNSTPRNAGLRLKNTIKNWHDWATFGPDTPILIDFTEIWLPGWNDPGCIDKGLLVNIPPSQCTLCE